MTFEMKELAAIGATSFDGAPIAGSKINDAETGLYHDRIRRTSLALLKHNDVELTDLAAREPGAMMALGDQLVASVEFYEKSCEAMNAMFARILVATARCATRDNVAATE